MARYRPLATFNSFLESEIPLIMWLKQSFKDAAIRLFMVFLLVPIIESIIDSTFYWYEGNNIELFTIIKTIIEDSFFTYVGYVYGYKLYMLRTILVIFGITFAFSVLARRLSIYDKPIIFKKILLYLTIVITGVFLLQLFFNIFGVKIVMAFLLIETITTILIILYYNNYFKQIIGIFRQFFKSDICK